MNTGLRWMLASLIGAVAHTAVAQIPRVEAVLPQGPVWLEGEFSAYMDDTRLAINAPDPDLFQLQIYDISQPGPPQHISDIPNLFGGNEDIWLNGDILWVSYFDDWPFPIDISDPLNPQFPESPILPYENLSGDVNRLEVRDGKFFVFQSPELIVIDASDPATMTEIARFRYLPNALFARAVVSDTHLYVYESTVGGPWSGRLLIWDITDLTAPVLLSETPMLEGWEGGGIALGDGILTLSRVSTPLATAVIDVSDPLTPVVASTLDVTGLTEIEDRVALGINIFNGCGELTAYDLSDPTQPIGPFGFDINGGPRHALEARSGRRAVISAWDDDAPGTPPTFYYLGDLFGSPRESGLPYDVILSGTGTVIGPDDTTLAGKPLADIDVLVGQAELPPDSPFTMLPCPTDLFIDGSHEIGSLTVSGTITVTLNGKLTTTDLNLLNGATLNHDAEVTTEVP